MDEMEIRLTTQDLVLDALAEQDAPALAELGNDLRIARMMLSIPHPFSPADARRRIQRRRWQGKPGFSLAVRKRDDTLIGEAGLGAEKEPSLAYWLGVAHWGRGYGMQAAEAVTGMAFSLFPVEALTAGTYDDNPASSAILRKLGFRRVEIFREEASVGRATPSKGWDWRLTRAAWEAREQA